MQATVSRNESPAAAGLRALFGRLQLGFVKDFLRDSSDTSDIEQPVVMADLSQANIITSRYNDGTARHALLLDLDHPAWLVKSTTEGHFHLYVDVPGGIPHERYFALLGSLADCGVIERGYEKASRVRGFSSLRQPWVKKEGGGRDG